ncbi:MAG: peptidoglycan recognition family protein [Caryophanon sp.]|nr:peptidoglycan recognition family protein [Caryophanon sp.]
MAIRRGFTFLLLLTAIFFVGKLLFSNEQIKQLKDEQPPRWVDQQYITAGYLSRPGRELQAVNDIVIHYVGNPSSTAQQNRDYFDTPTTKVSAHFVIGLQGEIIQALPLHEMSLATNWRNRDTISIEVTHPDASGQFTKASYDALVRLTAWLLHVSDLPADNVIRHYDVTGKLCPLYYVENEDEWLILKQHIADAHASI